ncbi:capsule assembly Wzi family protein [Bryocella elongata]|nr:capsule assembly Wzi family protein [Bryocella elongata]
MPIPTDAAEPTYPPPSAAPAAPDTTSAPSPSPVPQTTPAPAPVTPAVTATPQPAAPVVAAPVPQAPVAPAIPSGAPVQTSPTPSTPGELTPEQTQTANVKPRVFTAMPPYDPFAEAVKDALGSTYIPVDSPIYAMAMRLYSMGYLDSAFLGMRPWTRRSVLHMIEKTEDDVLSSGNDQAIEILAKLQDYLLEEPRNAEDRGAVYGFDTYYTRMMGIAGPVLRDSFHLGQTRYNDYGRPYATGFNNVTGFSSVNEWWRFSFYVRGEFQHAPAYSGYPLALAQQLSSIDEIAPFSAPNNPQATIPYGNTGAQNPLRLQEAAISFHILGHEISGGKTDSWLGPGMGGAMAWSNNAENIYSFRINRVEPLHIPLLSRVLGPTRYDFFVGSLKGHTDPNDPWIHSEMISFHPTKDFEFGFQRSVIWGGKGHEPVTFHTFLKSFFSTSDTTGAVKYSREDPGARFTAFNFSWRLPFLSHYLTLYTDSETHDDVFPISAPRRAAYRPGIYLSQFPGMPKLDLRVEATSTDGATLASVNGSHQYWEVVQVQGYTNKGYILGDWIGREAKGGQAWLTYHLSGNEWVQMSYLNKKNAKDFIPGGTTQNQFTIDVVKRLRPELELNAWYTYERWKAPIWKTGQQTDSTIAAQFTWYPRMKTTGLNGK